MRKLKRSECAVIHLVLKHKWYDMIASGYKVEEYRADTPHWSARLNTWMDEPKKYHVVAFQRGYHKASMWFICNEITPTDFCANPQWGEKPEPHYIIFLDERVELEEGARDDR